MIRPVPIELSDIQWATLARQFRLARRELEATRGIFEGKKHALIAWQSGLQEYSVLSNWRRAKRKLNCRDRNDLLHLIYNMILRGEVPGRER
ncbi:MAG: hypothetical protein ACR2GY_00015 [Phycisphaerales bacterium]